MLLKQNDVKYSQKEVSEEDINANRTITDLFVSSEGIFLHFDVHKLHCNIMQSWSAAE